MTGRSLTRGLVLICLSLLTACGRPEINRDRWMKMSDQEKRLTVSSLRGREMAMAHKGGAARPAHPASDERYVARIDEAYRAGDRRTVTAIWDSQSPGRQ